MAVAVAGWATVCAVDVVDPAPPKVRAVPRGAALAATAFDRLTSQAAPRPMSKGAVTGDWPRLLGSAHDATSPETHLLHELPGSGPRIVWEVAKGNGFGGPAIVGGRLVIFHRMDGKEIAECLDSETGKRFWNYEYPAPYRPRYGGSEGPRTSPVIAEGRVFTFGVSGQLHCFDLASGTVCWERDLAREFEMGPAFFGYGSTPLVAGSRVIVQLGGRLNGNPVNSAAFDVATGKLVWIATDEWGASYASSDPARLHGRDCVLVFAGGESRPPTGGLLIIDATTGAVLARAGHRADIAESVSASSPVVAAAEPGKPVRVFVSESYSAGGACFDIGPDFSIKPAWRAPNFGLYWMTPLVRDGALVGWAGQSEQAAEFVAHEITTGKELWRSDLGGGFGRASLLAVDGGVLCLGEFGDLAWVEVNRRGAAISSRAKLFNAPETWTLPAVSHGLLYVSQNEQGTGGARPRIICYDLRGD
jgi:outer membrane protein assembly factor BamB